MSRAILTLLLVVAPAFAEGKRYALLVGVGRYDGKNTGGLSVLEFAQRDPALLGPVLKKAGFAEVVMMTCDARPGGKFRATSANIRARLAELLAKVTPGDHVVFHFSGNERQKGGSAGYLLCPADTDVGRKDTMISLGEVCAALEKTKAASRVVIIDSCRPLEKKGKDAALTPAIPSKNVAVLFACSAGEEAFEVSTLKAGVLTAHVVKGLQGAADRNKDGKVSWAELTAYVRSAVPKEVRQQPEVLGKADQPLTVSVAK